jgi:hypothetical protein
MVVLLTVPNTSTVSPAVTALAEAADVPFWYVVDDDRLTVTFSPAEVVNVKLDADTVPTAPIVPPAAGADRALEPPPPPPGPPGAAADDEVDAVGVGVAAAAQPASPIAAHVSTAGTINHLFRRPGFRPSLAEDDSFGLVTVMMALLSLLS